MLETDKSREIDVRVSEEIMGQPVGVSRLPDYPDVVTTRWISPSKMLPGYSSDPTSAMWALEVVRSQGFPNVEITGDDDGWFVRVHGWGTGQRADTLASAMCLALLSEYDRSDNKA